MTIKELKEQLQEDLISFLGDFIDQEEMDFVCLIVIDRVNAFEKSNKTES